MQAPEQTQNAVRRRLADLKTLRDMVRVDLNLAGKEARARWQRIEARISAVENRVRGSAGFSVAPVPDPGRPGLPHVASS
jgi:hypothetical protein